MDREDGEPPKGEDAMPQYSEMISYLDGLLQPQGPNNNRIEEVTSRVTEGELLGYQWVTQEAQSQRMDGVLHGLAEAPNQTEDLNSVTERGDNLLDWTVRDQAETSIDYDLGEIANRSFQDKYGIWAGQEEIFPDWETKELEDSKRTGGLKPGDSKQSEEVQSNSEIEKRVGRVAPWALECYNRATKERVEMVEIHHPSG